MKVTKMIEEKYSAGLISQSFWFIEIKKVLNLIQNGKNESEIKKLCIDENLFGAAKEYRAKRMYGYIFNRVKKIFRTHKLLINPPTLINCF